MTNVKTHCDRLGNSWEGILELRVQIFGFGKDRGPHRGFGCCPIVTLSFFYLLHPMRLRNFFRFCSRLLFRVFTLESYSFFSFSFFFLLSNCALENSKFIPNRWMIYQDFWLRKRDDSLVDYENFLKEKPLQSKYLRSIKMDFLGM